MSVQLTTTKLFELLGSAYAEARLLADENAQLKAEIDSLRQQAAKAATEAAATQKAPKSKAE